VIKAEANATVRPIHTGGTREPYHHGQVRLLAPASR
jgi:hypothetical protein